MKNLAIPKLMKLLDFSLQVLLSLETVSENKIKIFNEASKGSSASFAGMVIAMSEVQQSELKTLQDTITVIGRVKQLLCSHPKKYHDTCEGTKYCMNCNLTLLPKKRELILFLE